MHKLTLDLKLNMENTFLNGFEFTGNAEEAVSEYYERRKIKPWKVLVHGPPNSGKTTLAKAIAFYYGMHYVNPDEIVEETKCRLVRIGFTSQVVLMKLLFLS